MRRSLSAAPSSLALAGVLALSGLALSPATAAPEAPSAPLAAEPLPTDPSLITGELDNGMRYIVKKHGNPEGKAALWLHINTGSTNETDKQRGIAHYLEHMAFNGSKNFGPGEVVPFFQSLGLQFGRHQNASTSFDQTNYQLFLQDTKEESIGKGMLFMSDVATQLSLFPKEIESERQIILEERRTRLGADQRIQEYVFERLIPGSTFGMRLPIGTEATIRGVQQADFLDYYARWYVPSNMCFIVVADTDPAPIVALIKKTFSGGEKKPRPVDLDLNIKPYEANRAIVATDEELKNGDLGITKVAKAYGGVTTVEQVRRDLVETIGTWSFNRRNSQKIAEGKLTAFSISASSNDMAQAIRMTTVNASGKPENWKTTLAEMATELQRARLNGFTAREIDDARTEMIANAEQSAKREGTMPANNLVRRLSGETARGNTIMSATQRMELLKKLLPTITAEEVSKVFATNFDPSAVTFVAELPKSAEVPSESDLVALGTKCLNVKPEKDAEAARATSILKESPKPGAIAESTEHGESKVTTATLTNGVVVHYKFVDQRKDDVSITIALATGEIAETAETKGIAQAAGLAWMRPATSTLTSTQIRDLMNGKKVRAVGGSGADSMAVTLSGSPSDLKIGMELAYAMLTDPVLEKATFDKFKEQQLLAIAERKTSPGGVIQEVRADAVLPKGEARSRPMEKENVDRLTQEACQAFLKKAIATAPIEVAVVGDISKDDAMALVQQYIGALPPRTKIDGNTNAALKAIKHNTGPIKAEKAIATKTPQAQVQVGFFSCNIQDVKDVRLMTLASRVISTRMVKTIREEKQLVYSISCGSQAATAYKGMGFFGAGAPTEPVKATALGDAIEEMLADFAKSGPTEDELNIARQQIIKSLDEDMKAPDFWAQRLGQIAYRGLSLDDVMSAPAAYAKYTPAEVLECYKRYYKPENMVRVIVRPDAGSEAAFPASPAPEKK